MKPEEQLIKIAEACGWTEITYSGHRYQGIRPKNTKRYCNWNRPAPAIDEGDKREWHWVPDYLNDLNACHEMEKVIVDLGMEMEYREMLGEVCGQYQIIWYATARQRAEAFLHAIDKWEETESTSNIR